MTTTPYNQTFLPKDELASVLSSKIEPEEVNKVISAYEFAESVQENKFRSDGTPYFYHTSRVAKILLDELQLFDTDAIVSALLHDVLEDSEDVSRELLEYNFGNYVAYVVETLTKNLKLHKEKPDEVDLEHVEQLKHASFDCLIIRLAARLDNFRCLKFDLKQNPIKYIENTSKRYLPLAEKTKNPLLIYLVAEIKRERNKFLG